MDSTYILDFPIIFASIWLPKSNDEKHKSSVTGFWNSEIQLGALLLQLPL